MKHRPISAFDGPREKPSVPKGPGHEAAKQLRPSPVDRHGEFLPPPVSPPIEPAQQATASSVHWHGEEPHRPVVPRIDEAKQVARSAVDRHGEGVARSVAPGIDEAKQVAPSTVDRHGEALPLPVPSLLDAAKQVTRSSVDRHGDVLPPQVAPRIAAPEGHSVSASRSGPGRTAIGGHGRTDDSDEFPTVKLTRREQEVLELLASGLKNREIADVLVIEKCTAELHVSRILGKLGCSTRAQAAAHAIRNGLVPFEVDREERRAG